MEEAKKGGIELNISDEIAQGKYCNFALITTPHRSLSWTSLPSFPVFRSLK